jgi:hypothetical protein
MIGSSVIAIKAIWQCCKCSRRAETFQIQEAAPSIAIEPPPEWSIAEHRTYCPDHVLIVEQRKPAFRLAC